jgi:hypothetical protein
VRIRPQPPCATRTRRPFCSPQPRPAVPLAAREKALGVVAAQPPHACSVASVARTGHHLVTPTHGLAAPVQVCPELPRLHARAEPSHHGSARTALHASAAPARARQSAPHCRHRLELRPLPGAARAPVSAPRPRHQPPRLRLLAPALLRHRASTAPSRSRPPRAPHAVACAALGTMPGRLAQELGAARSHTGQEHAEGGRQGGKKSPRQMRRQWKKEEAG